MSNMEDQGTNRRRRSSITIAILQRRHVTAFDYDPYAEDDNVYLLNNYNRDTNHAIYGFKIRAISSAIPGTSSSMQTIEQLNIFENKKLQFRNTTDTIGRFSNSLQNIGKINIMRPIKVIIGSTVKLTTEKLDSETSEALEKVLNSSGSIQNIDEINVYEPMDVIIGPTLEINMPTDETQKENEEPTPLPVLESGTTNIGSIKPNERKKIRYKIAVFVFFFVVVGCNISQIAYMFSSKGCENHDNNSSSPFIKLNIPEWWYKCRWSWEAEPPRERSYFTGKIHYVIIGHSEFDYCDEMDTCVEKVQAMQRSDKMDKCWDDIGPNFLISPDGLVFEGRGANVKGKMLDDKYNNRTITIMFLGDYERNQTCSEQFDHLKVLLTELIDVGVLAKDYSLLGECQISEELSVSPGPNVIKELRDNMDHWHSGRLEGCVTHEDIEQYMHG